MFSVDDTIVAIATPPGSGGIGVVRLSGPSARVIACALTRRGEELEPRRATFARFYPDREAWVGGAADHVILTSFPAPHSYTGEDVVEISGHGSPVLLRTIVSAAMAHGARLAEPGEFTLRAFLHERIDLVQAEAVRDLSIGGDTAAGAGRLRSARGHAHDGHRESSTRNCSISRVKLEASLDFPDEGYHFIESGDAAREIAGISEGLDVLLGTAARGRRAARRTARGARRAAERRQIELVQQPCGKGPRDRYRYSRHDARSAGRNGGRRRHSDDARRHCRDSAGRERSRGDRGDGARRCRPGRRARHRRRARSLTAARWRRSRASRRHTGRGSASSLPTRAISSRRGKRSSLLACR